MASLTLADAASRAGPMDDVKKPKRWGPKAKVADAPDAGTEGKSLRRSLAKLITAMDHTHTAASKGSLYKNRD